MTCNHHESPSVTSNNAPLVSVVVPVFNVEQYLPACLDSVLGQTLQDIEVICVDDGSSDASRQILEHYARRDCRLRAVFQENRGQSSARNRGLELVRGQFVYFLDSDDTIVPHALAELSQCARANQLDLIQFNMETVFESEELRHRHPNMRFRPRNGNYPGIWNGEAIFAKMFENRDYRISPCINFIRTEMLREAGLRFIEGVIYEDNSFTLMLMLTAKRVSYLDQALYHYRVRPHSTITSSIGIKNLLGYITNCSAMLQFVKSRDLSACAAAAANQQIAFIFRQAANVHRGLPLSTKQTIAFPPRSMESALHKILEEQERWWGIREMTSNNEKQAELAQAQERIACLKTELALLQNSYSMRIGRALTMIPRKLLKILQRRSVLRVFTENSR
jgi:cellulose synthase/poly-beta-1,6-N-acetylglucosamine synthase-like glycosyltransferase